MPTTEARVPTERASRYLVQLCKHASQMGPGFPAHPGRRPHMNGERPKSITAEWSETDGTITLDWGTCVLRATPQELTLRVEAADEDRLQRIQSLLTRNLTRMSRRDNLTVNWGRPDGTPTPSPPKATPRRGRHTVLGLTMAGILAVAVHAGLVAGVLTVPQWAGWGADVVLVAVLVKAAFVAAHLWRRRQAR